MGADTVIPFRRPVEISLHLVPKMMDNNTTDFEISTEYGSCISLPKASNSSNAYLMYNENINDGHSPNSCDNNYIGFKFNNSYKVKAVEFYIAHGSPSYGSNLYLNITLVGSNDGTNWEELSSKESFTCPLRSYVEGKIYSNSDKIYSHYAITITDSYGVSVLYSIRKLQFYGYLF